MTETRVEGLGSIYLDDGNDDRLSNAFGPRVNLNKIQVKESSSELCIRLSWDELFESLTNVELVRIKRIIEALLSE